MRFNLKTWVNRISEYPTRRKLTKSDGSTELVTVERAEGQVSQEGNAFSADEMNDLEKRISEGFDGLNNDLDKRLLNGIGNLVLQKGTNIDNIHRPFSTFSSWVAFNDANHGAYVTGSNPLNASYTYYGIMLFMENAQIFIKYPENRAYSRVYANDSWGSWEDYAKTNHKQAYVATELDTYEADESTMGVTPAGVRKAINGRFSLSGTTLYINTL